MQFSQPSGYQHLKNKFDNSGITNKEDKDFVKARAVDVNNWFLASTTLHLMDVLGKEIERHINELKKCDSAEAMKYAQGKVDGFEKILSRLNSLSETAKKITREA